MDGEAQGGCGLLQPLTGPSAPRFCRKRFESEDALKIHVALSISLFLLNLTFFINLELNPKLSPVLCPARGAIFHYFLLCVFTWMGLEAFHLYLLIIRVFNTYFGHYLLKLSLVGWGRCRLGGAEGMAGPEGAGRGAALGRVAAPSLRQIQGLQDGQLEGALERGMSQESQQCHASSSHPGLPALMVIGTGSAKSYGNYTIRDQEGRTTLEL